MRPCEESSVCRGAAEHDTAWAYKRFTTLKHFEIIRTLNGARGCARQLMFRVVVLNL